MATNSWNTVVPSPPFRTVWHPGEDAMTAKPFAVGLAIMLTMVGGAAAITAGPAQPHAQAQETGLNATAPGEADIGATYDSSTVTVTVTQDGESVENASVEINEQVYTTDANGTVVTAYDGDTELEIEVDTSGFEGKVTYNLVGNSLLIQDEEYEYNYGEEREDEEENESEEEYENEEKYEDEDEEQYEDEDDEEYENEEQYEDEQEDEDE